MYLSSSPDFLYLQAVELVLRSDAQTAAADLPVRRQGNHTLLSAPPACRQHRTAPEPIVRGTDIPPENVKRLHVLTDLGIP